MDHPLKEFLDAVEDSAPAFARRVGVRSRTLQRILAGEEWPSPALARRIVDATDGAVPFDALYGSFGDVADFGARRGPDDTLNQALLAEVLCAAMKDFAGSPDCEPWSREIEIAAEAVANTYAALARATTRQGLKDRVAQALRPVLAEILRDYGASGIPPARLDEMACCIAALYCETRSSPR